MATQTDEIKVETPVGEGNKKPEAELMSMTVPTEFLEKETPTTETKVENKAPLDESSEEDESSRKDVKITSNEEWTDEDQKHLSDRAQKRIRDLNEKAKKAEELETEVKILRGSKQKEMFLNPYDNAIKQPLWEPKNAKEDNKTSIGELKPQSENPSIPWDINPQEPQYEEKVLSPEEYQRDVLSTADIIVQARLGQYQKSVEIQKDLEKMEQKYEELNPDSPEYSEDISKKLANLFEGQLKANPNAKLSTFVDSIMSLREEKAIDSEKKAKASLSARTLDQKAEEAITPHEIEPEVEKPYETLSIESKEAYLKEKGLWN